MIKCLVSLFFFQNLGFEKYFVTVENLKREFEKPSEIPIGIW
jgi:hypothetical protein